jgi:hypothetical protein
MLVKRVVLIFCILVIGFSTVVFSEENESLIYLEFGLFTNLGSGKAKYENYPEAGNIFMLRLGEVKVGYGHLFNLPLYAVGEFSATMEMGGGTSRGVRNASFDNISLFTGVGLIFFPIRYIQLGASLGVNWSLETTLDKTWTADQLTIDDYLAPGFGWNVSIAGELGTILDALVDTQMSNKVGLLLGLQISGSNYNFESYNTAGTQVASGKITATYVSGFLKGYWRFPITKK